MICCCKQLAPSYKLAPFSPQEQRSLEQKQQEEEQQQGGGKVQGRELAAFLPEGKRESLKGKVASLVKEMTVSPLHR